VPDGALNWAVVGSGMGAGDGVGEVVGVRVGVAVGEDVGEAAAFGWVVHAVTRRTRESTARKPQVPGVLIVVQCAPPSVVRWMDPRTVA
jgi:hypothetical protein